MGRGSGVGCYFDVRWMLLLMLLCFGMGMDQQGMRRDALKWTSPVALPVLSLVPLNPKAMADTPMTRHRKKANAAEVKDKNLAEMERFWKDLEDHAQHLEDNSKRAKKLAETVKTITITQKVAGRTVPNKTRYEQVITRKSDKPFKTDAKADTKRDTK